MDNWTFWSRFWMTMGAMFITLVVTLGVYNTYATREFVRGGYYECVLPGSNSARWCK